MGLDMYAYSVKADLKGQEVDIKLSEVFDDVDAAEKRGDLNKVAYWRKFNNLHGWMHRLYDSKGGKSEDFNCDMVNLTVADLDELAAEAKDLEPTGGFFFGSYDDMTKEDTEEVLQFVEKAKAEIADGRSIIYSSWW